jgi:hypothetical protein
VLAAAWEAEVVSARRMTALAERIGDARVRARLMVLAAFCRAHASRLLARLAALGRGPLPVPPEDIELDPDTILELSSAWVCELNRTEEQDRARELLALAEGALAAVMHGPSTTADAPAGS